LAFPVVNEVIRSKDEDGDTGTDEVGQYMGGLIDMTLDDDVKLDGAHQRLLKQIVLRIKYYNTAVEQQYWANASLLRDQIKACLEEFSRPL